MDRSVPEKLDIGLLFYGHEVLQVECADSQESYPYKHMITHPQHIRPAGGGGGGYSHTLPIRVCAAQRGLDFEAPDLEGQYSLTSVERPLDTL